MQVRINVRRYDPEKDRAPYWRAYKLEAEPMDRLIDLLMRIKEGQDGTLTFRLSCVHGICGSDAVVVNGRNRLACKVLVKDVGSDIRVEALHGLPLLKDLVVDMEPFFAQYRSVMPFLVNDEPAPYDERLQTPEARQRFDDTTKCILCGICTTSCPVFWANSDYLGPSAIVQAHRFIFDNRDRATQARLALVTGANGVWRCHTVYNCTEACPRSIDVTRVIGEIKQAALLGLAR